MNHEEMKRHNNMVIEIQQLQNKIRKCQKDLAAEKSGSEDAFSDLQSQLDCYKNHAKRLEKENQQLKKDANIGIALKLAFSKDYEELSELERLSKIGIMIEWAIKENVEFVSLGDLYNYGLEIINEEDLTRLEEFYDERGGVICIK